MISINSQYVANNRYYTPGRPERLNTPRRTHLLKLTPTACDNHYIM